MQNKVITHKHTKTKNTWTDMTGQQKNIVFQSSNKWFIDGLREETAGSTINLSQITNQNFTAEQLLAKPGHCLTLILRLHFFHNDHFYFLTVVKNKTTLTRFTLTSPRWGLLLLFLGDLLPRLAGDATLLPGERSLVTTGDLCDKINQKKT